MKIMDGAYPRRLLREPGRQDPKPEEGEDDVDYDRYGWSEHILKIREAPPEPIIKEYLRLKAVI